MLTEDDFQQSIDQNSTTMLVSWKSIEFVLICIAIIVIIVLTVGGNLVVLFAFCNDPHLLNPSNNFLLSMAIADLLVGLVGMPFHSYGQLIGYWPFGDLFCKIWLTIDDVVTMASVLSIVAITIERYWSINHSVHYRRYTTKTRIRLFSLLIWLIPFLNFAPGIWFLDPDPINKTVNGSNQNNIECIGAYHSHTLYVIIAQINFFAWPLTVIIVLNGLIVVNLYKRSHRFPVYASFRVSPPMINASRKQCHQKFSKTERQLHKEINNQRANRFINDGKDQNNTSLLNADHSKNHRNGFTISIPSSIDEVNEMTIIDGTNESNPSQSRSIEEQIEEQKKIDEQHVRYVFVPSSKNTSSNSSDRCSSKSTQTTALPTIEVTRRSSLNTFLNWRRTSLMLAPAELQLKTVSTVRNNNGEQRAVRRLRRDKRAATSLFTLVLVFMVFLLPYVVVVTIGNAFSIEAFTNTEGQLYSASFWLLWLNSTVNPIIYPFIQPRFREAYRKLFLRFTRRQFTLSTSCLETRRNK